MGHTKMYAFREQTEEMLKSQRIYDGYLQQAFARPLGQSSWTPAEALQQAIKQDFAELNLLDFRNVGLVTHEAAQQFVRTALNLIQVATDDGLREYPAAKKVADRWEWICGGMTFGAAAFGALLCSNFGGLGVVGGGTVTALAGSWLARQHSESVVWKKLIECGYEQPQEMVDWKHGLELKNILLKFSKK
ncbi:MAG: hypothetical protein HY540_04705 [Deltaproteobacteria bacterium]|nr:hypothetical protein [Deltaproteobacteria bacterium]